MTFHIWTWLSRIRERTVLASLGRRAKFLVLKSAEVSSHPSGDSRSWLGASFPNREAKTSFAFTSLIRKSSLMHTNATWATAG